MRYTTPMFLLVACIATTTHSMDPTSPRLSRDNQNHAIAPMEQRRVDSEQKTLALKAQFATMSWLQNTDAQEVDIHGLPAELATTEKKAVLQQAVLAALTAVSLQFPVPKRIWPTPTIDMQKLYALSGIIEQVKKEEAALKEKRRLEAIERAHNANITLLLEFNGIQAGFDYCREQQLPAWKYLPAICLAIGDNK